MRLRPDPRGLAWRTLAAGERDLTTAPKHIGPYRVMRPVARGGMLASEYSEDAGARVMAQDEFTVRVDLGRGPATETIWTSDFSYEYVRINAEYRT